MNDDPVGPDPEPLEPGSEDDLERLTQSAAAVAESAMPAPLSGTEAEKSYEVVVSRSGRTLVEHLRCQDGSWSVAKARPTTGLNTGLLVYREIQLNLNRPRPALRVPDTTVTLVLALHGHVRATSAATASSDGSGLTAALVGTSTGGLALEYDPDFQGIELTLTAWAAYTMTNERMSKLANRVTDLCALMGEPIQTLLAKLGAATDLPSRLALVEDFLTRCRQLGPAHAPLLLRAWGRLYDTHGSLPLAELVAETGFCERQVERVFRDQIGLTPRAVARVMRLRYALRMLASGIRFADVASSCGYFDQAHFNRDVKALTGRTPTGLQAAYTVGPPGPVITGEVALQATLGPGQRPDDNDDDLVVVRQADAEAALGASLAAS
jgi:AraC-like DNA-binding protein